MNWVGGTLYPGVKCSQGQDTVPMVSCPGGQDKPGGGTFYPGVKCPRGQDTVPTVSCPRGQDKPGGDILPWGKVSHQVKVHSYPGYCVPPNSPGKGDYCVPTTLPR